MSPSEQLGLDNAGAVYSRVIDELLAYEQERKNSLEQRALAVVTTSGVLVTLLIGFAGVNKTENSSSLPLQAIIPIIAAMSGFVIAVLLSLTVNRPVSHSPLGVKTDLRRMVEDDLWNQPKNEGLQAIAEFRVGEIDRWRDSNGKKASRLRLGIAFETASVALLAIAAGIILLSTHG